MPYYRHHSPFPLDSGTSLPELRLAYHTYGQLNAEKNNVIWVCHALTANSDVLDWWEGLVGPGKRFDPAQHYIVCANMIGSCYGSTGPLSFNPRSTENYYYDFPLVSVRDMARSLILLRQHLGIERIHTLIGGSMGGMQALEWAILEAERIERLVVLATSAKHSAWGIAFNESQRMAIAADSTWGDRSPRAGAKGMKAARAMALLSYRHYATYAAAQSDRDGRLDNFKASTYQQYQGDKLEKRFNAFSYWALSKAMDSHDVGRGREGVEAALSGISARSLVIGIDTDVLFPPHEQRFLAKHIPGGRYGEIRSPHGHDAFLIEIDQIDALLEAFYAAEVGRHAGQAAACGI